MNSNSPVENTRANAVKAPKKPTLSAKYSRFLSFAHWFLTKTDLNEETRKQLYQQMMMFGSVEEQTVYFEGFFSDIKETNKVMRKMVAEAKKPPKAPKAPRAKKTKAAPAAQDELVAQLIADANGSEVAAAPTEAAAAKEKKPRAKKADAAEKPKKTKKSEAVPVVVDDASEDVQTRVVTIGDKEYLIDSENNLYDTTFPHDQVGTFHPETGSIQA